MKITYKKCVYRVENLTPEQKELMKKEIDKAMAANKPIEEPKKEQKKSKKRAKKVQSKL